MLEFVGCGAGFHNPVVGLLGLVVVSACPQPHHRLGHTTAQATHECPVVVRLPVVKTSCPFSLFSFLYVALHVMSMTPMISVVVARIKTRSSGLLRRLILLLPLHRDAVLIRRGAPTDVRAIDTARSVAAGFACDPRHEEHKWHALAWLALMYVSL